MNDGALKVLAAAIRSGSIVPSWTVAADDLPDVFPAVDVLQWVDHGRRFYVLGFEAQAFLRGNTRINPGHVEVTFADGARLMQLANNTQPVRRSLFSRPAHV